MSLPNEELSGRLQIVAGAALFSTGGAAIKATALTAWQVAAFRSAVAAATLLLVLPVARRGWSARSLPVALAYALTLILYVTANKLTTAANTIFLQSTAPLYLLLLGPWLLRERLRPGDVRFFLVLALGMTLIFLRPGPASETAPQPLLGNLLAGCAGLSWALTILGLRWLASRPGAQSGDAVNAVVSGNLLAVAMCVYWAFPVEQATGVDWLLIGYLGVFQIGLAYMLVTAGMRQISALEASLLILIEPVLNPVWVWIFQREQPGMLALLGGAIILGATALRASRKGAES